MSRVKTLIYAILLFQNFLYSEPNKVKFKSLPIPKEDLEYESPYNNSYTIEPDKLNVILKNAPPQVHELIQSLQTQNNFSNNKVILTGPSGSGKTDIATAIQQTSNRKLTTLEPACESYSVLIRSLQKILDNPEPQLVIIDEISQITKYDTMDPERNTQTLWSLFNECCNRSNVVIIGTTLELTDLSNKLKTKFSDSELKVNLPNEEQRYNILQYLCKKCDTPLAPEINDEFIKHLAKKTNSASIRGLKAIIAEAVFIRYVKHRETNEPIIVNQSDFKDSLNNLGFNKSKILEHLNTLKETEIFNLIKRTFFYCLGEKTANLIFKTIFRSITD